VDQRRRCKLRRLARKPKENQSRLRLRAENEARCAAKRPNHTRTPPFRSLAEANAGGGSCCRQFADLKLRAWKRSGWPLVGDNKDVRLNKDLDQVGARVKVKDALRPNTSRRKFRGDLPLL